MGCGVASWNSASCHRSCPGTVSPPGVGTWWHIPVPWCPCPGLWRFVPCRAVPWHSVPLHAVLCHSVPRCAMPLWLEEMWCQLPRAVVSPLSSVGSVTPECPGATKQGCGALMVMGTAAWCPLCRGNVTEASSTMAKSPWPYPSVGWPGVPVGLWAQGCHQPRDSRGQWMDSGSREPARIQTPTIRWELPGGERAPRAGTEPSRGNKGKEILSHPSPPPATAGWEVQWDSSVQ